MLGWPKLLPDGTRCACVAVNGGVGGWEGGWVFVCVFVSCVCLCLCVLWLQGWDQVRVYV